MTISLPVLVGVGLALCGFAAGALRTSYIRKHRLCYPVIRSWIVFMLVIPVLGFGLTAVIDSMILANQAQEEEREKNLVLRAEHVSAFLLQREKRRNEKRQQKVAHDKALNASIEQTPEEWTTIRSMLKSHRLRSGAKMTLFRKIFENLASLLAICPNLVLFNNGRSSKAILNATCIVMKTAPIIAKNSAD